MGGRAVEMIQVWDGSWIDPEKVQALVVDDFSNYCEIVGCLSATAIGFGKFETLGEAESARDELAKRINDLRFKWR